MSSLGHTLEHLVWKYDVLIALRRERDALQARGILKLTGAPQKQRHARMRELATAFPGSLRELEYCNVTTLQERRRVLQRELEEAHAHPRRRFPHTPWVRWMDAFHRELRERLMLRRAGQKGGAGSQLSAQVMAQLSQRLKISPARLEAALYGKKC